VGGDGKKERGETLTRLTTGIGKMGTKQIIFGAPDTQRATGKRKRGDWTHYVVRSPGSFRCTSLRTRARQWTRAGACGDIVVESMLRRRGTAPDGSTAARADASTAALLSSCTSRSRFRSRRALCMLYTSADELLSTIHVEDSPFAPSVSTGVLVHQHGL
jgi:hypothetical protein